MSDNSPVGDAAADRTQRREINVLLAAAGFITAVFLGLEIRATLARPASPLARLTTGSSAENAA